MKYYLKAFQNYAKFSGRSTRTEFWMFILFNILVSVGILILMGIGLSISDLIGMLFGLVYLVYAVAIIIPVIALYVRRFHDMNKSGWFVLLGLIPFFGPIALIVFMCLPGTTGENRFGPDPKSMDEAEM